MRDRVALYTWCYDIGKTNYGQMLQCYAMQKVFHNLGFECGVIRFRRLNDDENPPIYDEVKQRYSYEIEYRIKCIEGNSNIRIKRFIEFMENHIHSLPVCYSEEELDNLVRTYDFIVCGSDQLWASHWFDKVSLLDFGVDNQRRFTYATSGIIDEKDGEIIASLLKDSSHKLYSVSVRESYSKDILKKYLSVKNVYDVLDPTFLLESNEWDDLVDNPYENNEEYILCYFLDTFTPKKIIIKEMMKKHGVDKVKFIKSNLFPDERVLSEGKFFSIEDAGPIEFIRLVRNAKVVYTDSFHGTVFSIIYKKTFYISKFSNPGRINDLLSKFRIGDRHVDSVKQLVRMNDLDYELIECKKNEWIKHSYKFLKHSLGGDDNECEL